jgi:hypothetical protein
VQLFRWPVRVSELSKMQDRLMFDRNSGLLAQQWWNRHTLRGATPSFDQERRLLNEEWTRKRTGKYAQPHLVMAFSLSPSVQTMDIKRALDLVVSQSVSLRVAFVPVAVVPPEEHERQAAKAYHCGGLAARGTSPFFSRRT